MGILDAVGLKSIQILDCGEELIQLSEADFVLDPIYYQWGHSPSDLISLRSGVVERLRKAQAVLRKVAGCEDWGLKIWDGFRTLATQQSVYEAYWKELLAKNPDWSEDELREAVEIFVSPANKSRKLPPPHNTGGAVDLTLVDGSGKELPMGTTFDEFNVRSYTDHFDDGKGDGHFLMAECLRFRTNRRLLLHIMETVDLKNYAEEWWHFSYGDQAWASAKNFVRAVYGSVEL